MSAEYPHYDRNVRKWYRLEEFRGIKIKEYEPLVRTGCGLDIAESRMHKTQGEEDIKE